MNKNFTIFAAFLGIGANVFIAAERAGYKKGHEYAQELLQNCVQFAISGDDGLAFLIWTHYSLAAFFALVIIGGNVRNLRVAYMIIIFSLLGVSALYLRWLGLMISNSELTFSQNLANTFHALDFLSVLLLVFLWAIYVREVVVRGSNG